MLLAALALFRRLQQTAFESIQLASTLAQVSDRGRDVIDDLYREGRAAHPAPGLLDAAAPRREVCWPKRAAVLQVIDVPPLIRRERRNRVPHAAR